MMKQIKKSIISLDVFGYPITLNFNKKSTTFQTIYGGFSTILILSVLFAYLVLLLQKMIYHQQDMITSNQQSLDLGTLGNQNLNQTRISFFHWMLKDKIREDYSLEDLKRNLDIYYEQNDQNWYTNYELKRRVEVKWCTQDDFGNDDEGRKIFKTWDNTLILCPDLQPGQNLYLADDGFQMVRSQINIRFERCKINCDTD